MMFAPDDLNIQYDSTRTQTAIETFQSRRGNCLSMTNLYVAAARYLKVDANYQVVALNPTWEKTGAVMIRNEHINAIGRLSGIGKYVVDFRPNITFRDKDTQTISDREAVALYYTNLGAESIVAGEPDAAVRYIRSALAITPESADAWNNMGAAARRLGRFEQAEFSYQRAVHLDPYHYTAMNNLGRLYRGRGDLGREKHYLDRVKRYRAKHPYYLYFEARRAYQRNDLLAARKYLKRAIYRKRDDPEFYVALSNVYRQLGDQRRSDINMRKAEEYRKAVPQYDHEQEMDLLVDGPIMSIQYKVTRIPDG
jgi:Flp pilus assembly protein TadD|tara:strand:- start:3836 stop:4765 length:930 start_codon:yes stop_codon:yes gene_type:complete